MDNSSHWHSEELMCVGTIEFWREAKILSKLHHPNVVAFYGVVQDGPGRTLATVTEFMVSGSLQNVLLMFLFQCSFEGGIAGEPGFEAHGRYTFCGLATLILINEVHRLDLRSLLDRVVFRQAGLECGFQGRTNKLVDGCYSFWHGGVCSPLKRLSLDIDEQSVQPYAREGSSFDDLSTGMPNK
ncbi:hypothetical protein IC582_021618 [Cucumis melo]